MGDVQINIEDGKSGISPSGSSVVMFVGTSSIGDHGNLNIVGRDTDIDKVLGPGQLGTRVKDFIACNKVDTPILAVTVKSSDTIPVISDIDYNGSGPAMTVSSLGSGYHVACNVIIKIITGGAFNTATYTISYDFGISFESEQTVPVDGVINLDLYGVKASIADTADLITGDEYSFSVFENASILSDIMDVISENAEKYSPEMIYVCGESDSADWAAFGVFADEMWAKKKPVYFICESKKEDPETGYDKLVSDLLAERESFSHPYVSVSAVSAYVTDSSGYTFERNVGALFAGRLLSVHVARVPGRILDGNISQIQLPESYTSAHQKILEDAGFITPVFRHILQGVYWGECKTLAPKTSDYQHLNVVRTVQKAHNIIMYQAYKSLFNEAGDPVLPGSDTGLAFLKASIESGLNQMTAAIPAELAGYVVDIPAGQDIVNNGVSVNVTLIAIPIMRSIQINLSYVYAGSSFDPRLN
jgi:hypothetical protein